MVTVISGTLESEWENELRKRSLRPHSKQGRHIKRRLEAERRQALHDTKVDQLAQAIYETERVKDDTLTWDRARTEAKRQIAEEGKERYENGKG